MQTVPADAPAWNATGYDAVRATGRAARSSRDAARERDPDRDATVRQAAAHLVPSSASGRARRRASIRGAATGETRRRWARLGWSARGDAREDRHHLLSDVRRLRRRGDRARHRARAARPRDPLHHLPAAVPAAGVPAAHLLPRSGRRPVSAVRVSAVRSRARRAHARGGARRTGSTCCTATTRFRTRRARGSRKEMLRPTRPDIRVVTTLHGTDITIVGQDPSFRADHEVLDREVGRPHRRVAVPADARRSRRSAARRAASRSSRTSSIPRSTTGRGTRRCSTSRSTRDARC